MDSDPPGDEVRDFDLIRRMADDAKNSADARVAWGLLYIRHHDFLMDICAYDYGYLLGRAEIQDLVNEAFMKAFCHADSFNTSEQCEPLVQERKSRRWLARIAENLVRDRHRGQPEVSFLHDEDLERLGSNVPDEEDGCQVPESRRMKLLESGFALLSDSEQTILRATMFWWQGNRECQRMPHAAMEQLARQVGKRPENIRQIRARALKKLLKHVNEAAQDEEHD
jgi:RNA polymerase sigma factor (sigma-70 family)